MIRGGVASGGYPEGVWPVFDASGNRWFLESIATVELSKS